MHELTPLPSYEHLWTTGDELKFLEGLGTHRHTQRDTVFPRLVRISALKVYLRLMDQRVRWGQIDPGRLRYQVLLMIRSLEMQGPGPEFFDYRERSSGSGG